MKNHTLEFIVAFGAMILGVFILVMILRDIEKNNNDLDL